MRSTMEEPTSLPPRWSCVLLALSLPIHFSFRYFPNCCCCLKATPSPFHLRKLKIPSRNNGFVTKLILLTQLSVAVVSGAPNKKNRGKNWNAIFWFLVRFYGFWKFKWLKIVGNGILFPEFSSWYLPSKNRSWAFIAPTTAVLSSENNTYSFDLYYENFRWHFTSKNASRITLHRADIYRN